MNRAGGLLGKLSRAFWLQILLITLAAIFGVYLAKVVIEEILIKNAILDEVQYFSEQYKLDPNFNLPDTRNMSGYFDSEQLPPVVRAELPGKPGFYEFDDLSNRLVLYRTTVSDEPFYLVYYRGQVDALILYYGIFPLLAVLTILYLTLWLVYRFSHRSISPIARLANRIDRIDLSQDDFSLALENSGVESNDEIQVLAEAIAHLGERLSAFIDRERDFTRDASHEFRTPLTVIKIAIDTMLMDKAPSAEIRSGLNRIRAAVNDLENLTEVFLLLAREHGNSLTLREVDVNQLVREQIHQTAVIKKNKDVTVCLEERAQLRLVASETVVAVLLGNLIRNALLYTQQGEVNIGIDANQLTISDSGEGIPQSMLQDIFKPFQRASSNNDTGIGIGLAIVKRLCDRFGWKINVASESGQGTTFTLVFDK